MNTFNGKKVLITGASSGIGKAIALQLAKKGADLLLAGRQIQRLECVCNDCKKLGINADFAFLNFSDFSSIDHFHEKILSQNLYFDYLILNAGISQRALTLDTDFSVDQHIMNVNYFGPVYLIKKLEKMLRTSAMTHIVVTSSISGLFGFPLRSAYCASKHALFGFFESLELENENIKVTFLIPGRINTEISKKAILGDGTAYDKMDSGQANGMDVEKCAKIAICAIEKGKRRQLIGGKELMMAYLKKYCPALFFKLSKRISAT